MNIIQNSKDLKLIYIIYFILLAVGIGISYLMNVGYLGVYVSIFMLLIFMLRPNSILHNFAIEKLNRYKTFINIIVTFVTVMVCVLPMSKFPLWNGEIPGHRNQYELMAESILNGRINIEYGDEEELLKLDNPYDPVERAETGVKYHWDHAYYNGQYYMYFGIVPVFLTFLPYRILTGTTLTTYHATQIFSALIIVGIFTLFHMLAKLFFKKLSYSIYLSLSITFSIMSVWYSTAEPALYCTAITSGIALQIWSLYFFVRAVWYEKGENRQILFAGIGSILGALVFGCRPPIAFANILVIPMLITFLKQRKFTLKLLFKLILAASPYFIIAILLMMYNYARFENPFEFGQAYQLTVADQTNYGVVFNIETIIRIVKNSILYFFGRPTRYFPFITRSIFSNFPILLLCLLMFKKNVLEEIKQKGLLLFLVFIFLTVLIITILDILWTPFLLERYRMDIYFLMGIACFIIIGLWYNTFNKEKYNYISSFVTISSFLTVIFTFYLYLITVMNYYPDKVIEIFNALQLVK